MLLVQAGAGDIGGLALTSGLTILAVADDLEGLAAAARGQISELAPPRIQRRLGTVHIAFSGELAGKRLDRAGLTKRLQALRGRRVDAVVEVIALESGFELADLRLRRRTLGRPDVVHHLHANDRSEDRHDQDHHQQFKKGKALFHGHTHSQGLRAIAQSPRPYALHPQPSSNSRPECGAVEPFTVAGSS